MDTKEAYETEIDLVELFKAVLRGRLPIVCTLVVFIALSSIYCFNFMPDVYSATTSFYVLNQSDQTTISTSDLTSSAQLVNDYREIILSRRVTGAVADALSLDDLENFEIEVDAPTNTRIIEVTVTGEQPDQVTQVANGLAHEFSSVVVDIMRIDNVSIIDEALLPLKPSGPPRERYIILAALLGLVLSVGIIVVIEIFSNSFKSTDDIEKQTGLPVLAQIAWVEEKRVKGRKAR